MKKGQSGGDALAFFILFFFNVFILVVSFIFLIPILTNNAEYRIEKAFSERLDTSFISGYMHYPINSEIGHLLIESYLNDDYNDFIQSSDRLLSDTFGKEVAWRLFIDDEKVAEKCYAGCSGNKADYFTVMPLPYNPIAQTINVHLQVYP